MIIVLKAGTAEVAAKQLMKAIEDKGLEPLYMPGDERTERGAVCGRQHHPVHLVRDAYRIDLFAMPGGQLAQHVGDDLDQRCGIDFALE